MNTLTTNEFCRFAEHYVDDADAESRRSHCGCTCIVIPYLLYTHVLRHVYAIEHAVVIYNHQY